MNIITEAAGWSMNIDSQYEYWIAGAKRLRTYTSSLCLLELYCSYQSFPGLQPAFCCLQYRKESPHFSWFFICVLVSCNLCEHDIDLSYSIANWICTACLVARTRTCTRTCTHAHTHAHPHTPTHTHTHTHPPHTYPHPHPHTHTQCTHTTHSEWW